jgi:sec-independent protein translocase protein TatA
MFGLGWLEIGLILLAAVLVFGPKRLPEMGGAFGKTLRGFKEELRASEDELEAKDGDRPDSDQ